MSEQARRKELLAQYKQAGPQPGVYRLVNRATGRFLLGSTLNLGSMRGKLDFARATNSASALDRRVAPEVKRYGLEPWELEILEVLDAPPERTPAQVREDLTALEALWREKFDPALLY